MAQVPDSEAIAVAFHENYEQLAPVFGYTTRSESAKPWDELEVRLRALMVSTVNVVVTTPGLAFCWQQRADLTACDRAAGHLGKHSWEE